MRVVPPTKTQAERQDSPGKRGPVELYRFALLVGVASIALAMLIAAGSYYFALKGTERIVHDHYLNKARMLVTAAGRDASDSDDAELLAHIRVLWSSSVSRPEDEYICITDINSNLLLHSANPDAVGNCAAGNALLGSDHSPPMNLQELIDSKAEYVGEYVSSAGQEQIAAFAYLHEKDWAIGVHRSKAALDAQVRSWTIPFIAGFCGVILLLLPLSLILNHKAYIGTLAKMELAEKSVIESEIRLQLHITNTPIGVIQWNRKFEVTDWNPAAEQIFGHAAIDAIGRNAADLLIPEGARKLVEQVWTALLEQTGGNHSINENVTQDGHTIHCEWYNTPLVDEHGHVYGVASMVTDITEHRAADEALEASEQKYRLLADNVTDIIWTSSLDGSMTYVSPSVRQVRGFSVEEVIDQSLFESLTPESEAIVRERLTLELSLDADPAVDPNRSVTLVLEQYHQDGSIQWAEIRTTFLRDEDGKPTGLLGVTRNVSERRLAEKMLNDVAVGLTAATGREFFRSLSRQILNSLNIDYVLIGQLAPGNPTQIDTVAVCSHGKIIDNISYDLAGTPCGNVMSGKLCYHSSGVQQQFPQDALLGQMGVESYMGIPLWSSRGESLGLMALLHGEPFKNDELATSMLRIFGVRASAELERMQAEENTQRLVTAIDQSDETIMITNVDGTIEYVNPAFERITGYNSEEIIGENPRVLQGGELDHAFYQDLWSTISDGKVWKGRFTNKRKDDSLFFEEATISPVFDKKGKIINYVAVKRDVTKEMQLERQLRQTQKLEAIGAIAGGIAHDFNNILFAILGNADLAADTVPDDHPAAKNLAEIVTAGQRAAELVKQILASARQTDKNRGAMQLSPIVQEAVKLLRATLPTTIEISQQLGAGPRIVNADPTEIHQIVMNLCTNAGHAMMDRGGKLGISLSVAEVDDKTVMENPALVIGPYVVLSVSDTGPGIPPAVLDHIFEPFFTTKEPGEGTGMGLAVVHGTVQDLGGAITVSSSAGSGTILKVYLPLLDAENKLDVDAEEGPVPCGNERVLLVDDEPAIANMLATILEGLGYSVTTSISSHAALETYLGSTGQFDVVITDQTMPNITGGELATKILAKHPEQPIILCTGYSQTMPRDRADGIGISAYLNKPVSRKELAVTIRTVLAENAG